MTWIDQACNPGMVTMIDTIIVYHLYGISSAVVACWLSMQVSKRSSNPFFRIKGLPPPISLQHETIGLFVHHTCVQAEPDIAPSQRSHLTDNTTTKKQNSRGEQGNELLKIYYILTVFLSRTSQPFFF